MTPIMREALAIAAEECEARAGVEDSQELAHALSTIATMLAQLGKARSSPLFEDLKGRIYRSGDDGNKDELNAITKAVVAFLILCGRNQTQAAKLASSRCGVRAFTTVKNWFNGIENPESLRHMPGWKDMEARIRSAQTRVRYIEFLEPHTKSEDWDNRVLNALVAQVADLQAATSSQHKKDGANGLV